MLLQPFMHERCRRVEDVREIAAGRGERISSSCIESAAGAGMEHSEPMASTDACGWRRRREDGRHWLLCVTKTVVGCTLLAERMR